MRKTHMDLCRIAACVMVLLIHSSAVLYRQCPIDHSAFIPLSFIGTMMRGSVPVFFMLTGALFFSREQLELKSFFKSHVLRMLGLFFFWGAAYALLSRLIRGNFGSLYDFFMDLARGHYHLWFLTAMATVCLFLPVAHAALKGGRLDPGYLLFLFLFLGIFLANCNLTPAPTYILHQLTLNFSLSYLPYLGYAVWGWWLSGRRLGRRWLWIAPLVFFAVTAAAAGGNTWYSNYKATADGWLFSYFSLPSFIQASMIFCFFQAMEGRQFKRPELWKRLSKCTLGVYLIHPLVINFLELVGLPLSLEHPLSSLAVFTAVLSLICFFAAWLCSKLPIIKKLM